MRKHMIIITVAAAALAGCSSQAQEAPATATVTKVVTQAPEPAVSGSEPSFEVETDWDTGVYHDEIAEMALEMAWSDMSPRDKEDICTAFEINSEWAMDTFMGGGGDEFVSRGQAAEFFDRKCSSL